MIVETSCKLYVCCLSREQNGYLYYNTKITAGGMNMHAIVRQCVLELQSVSIDTVFNHVSYTFLCTLHTSFFCFFFFFQVKHLCEKYYIVLFTMRIYVTYSQFLHTLKFLVFCISLCYFCISFKKIYIFRIYVMTLPEVYTLTIKANFLFTC